MWEQVSLPKQPSNMPGLWLVSLSEDTKVSPRGAGWAELRPETMDGELVVGSPLACRALSKAGDGRALGALERSFRTVPGGGDICQSVCSSVTGAGFSSIYRWGDRGSKRLPSGCGSHNHKQQIRGAQWTHRSDTQWIVHSGVLSCPTARRREAALSGCCFHKDGK